jgi:AcrR family transcriptional regulator
MKYDLNKKMTRGAKRTLEDFSSTMFKLLSEKNFEEININELCKISMYPRATFYNYFDDKYDLLDYCWYVLSEEIKLDEFSDLPAEKLLTIYFDRIYDLLAKEDRMLTKILRHNDLNSVVGMSFINYLKKQMRHIFFSCIQNHSEVRNAIPVPIELVADHYSNTLLIVLEWIFFKQKGTSKEQGHHYLDYLLENIQ